MVLQAKRVQYAQTHADYVQDLPSLGVLLVVRVLETRNCLEELLLLQDHVHTFFNQLEKQQVALDVRKYLLLYLNLLALLN